MADLFEQYEREFLNKMTVIRERQMKLNEFMGEKRKIAVQETERQIDDAKQILHRMDQSLRNATKERQRRMENKMKGYQSDLNRVTKDLQFSNLSSGSGDSSNRNNNRFGRDRNYSDDNIQDSDIRSQMLVGNQQIEESEESLLNAHRIAIETENVGTAVLGELGDQGERLRRANENLSVIDDNMTRSRKILNAMTRRIATNKLILAFIILVLLLGNGLIIYFKWVGPLINKVKN